MTIIEKGQPSYSKNRKAARDASMLLVPRIHSLLSRRFAWMSDVSQPVEQVPDSQQRMAAQHSRASKSHNHVRLCFSCRLVAVNRTVGAGWFVLSIRTLFKPYFGIV